MSRKQFSGSMGRTIAELNVDASKLSGYGGADYPQLWWQLQLALIPQKTPHNDYAFRLVTAQLYLSAGQKIADARPIPMDRVIQGHQDYWGGEYLNFEFPLERGQSRTLIPAQIQPIRFHLLGWHFEVGLRDARRSRSSTVRLFVSGPRPAAFFFHPENNRL